MDKLKYIKLEQPDGSYSNSIPLAVDSDYVDVNGNTLTNELNNKATKIEVQAVASGSPAGVYTTVAALTTADPDHSRIYVVSATGHWYYYGNSQWNDGGVYQSTGIAEKSVTLPKLEDELQKIFDQNSLYFYINTDDFELGNIGINSTGWTYSNSNSRIRTKQNKTLSLKKDYTIQIPNGYVVYIGWKLSNNTYGFNAGWVSGTFRCTTDGEYVLLIRNSTEATISSDDIPSIINELKIIKSEYSTSKRVSQLEDCATKKDILRGLWELGSIGPNGIVSSTIRMNNHDFISFNDITILDIECLNNYQIAIETYSSSGDYTSRIKDSGWLNSCKYICYPEYYYCFNGRKSDDSSILNVTTESLNIKVYNGYENLSDDVELLEELNLTDRTTKKFKSNIFNVNHPVLVAHRGYSGIAPENTLPAFEEAGKAGFWGCETDVQETSDGYFVLCHNLDTEWATGTKLVIAESTYAQINALTINNGNNISQYTGLKIPLLEDYLKICKKFGMVPFIDSLQINSDSSWNNFFTLLDKYDLKDKCVFSTYQQPVKLTKIRKYTIKSPVILNIGNDWSGNSDYFLGLLNNWNNAGIAVNYINLNSTQTELLRNNKSIIGTWTIDSLEDANDIISLGADYIVTNSLSGTIGQIQSDLNDIRSIENVVPKNILNPSYKNEGYTRQWNTGAKVTGDYVTFEFIPIELNRNLYFSRGNGTTQSATVCCFDRNKNFIFVSGISDSQPYKITNSNVRYISVSIALSTYNAWKNTLMLEYDILSNSYEPYFDAYKIVKIYEDVLPPYEKIRNKNVCAVAHQGLSNTSQYYGNSRLSSIINASKYGFDYCETDLVFTSDNIPVCCHDTTFVDSTTSETVDITSKTYEQLQTYNYYGEKIASFENVLKACKLNGMGLFIDHVTEATEGDVDNRISILTQIVQKYNMQNSVKWICGRTSVITKILEWYKYSTICVNLGNMEGLTSLINTYSQYQTDYNKFIVTLNYSNFSVSDVITIRNTLPPSFDFAIWTIDDQTNYEKYLPYCNIILSNKLSPYIIASVSE